jgi:protein-tyrosine phosphatase
VTTLPDPTALDRSVAFAHVFNVRDLGGLPTADGRTVRRGLVYRADGVDRLDGSDLEVARALGLRTVIDLRTTMEVERRGTFPVDRLPVAWHHLPVLDGMWSELDLVASPEPWSWWPTRAPCSSTARRARTAPGWSRPWCSGCWA